MQRQRVLLMEGKLSKCPKELRNHPVFTLNETKNNFVVKRRGKVKGYSSTPLSLFCFFYETNKMLIITVENKP